MWQLITSRNWANDEDNAAETAANYSSLLPFSERPSRFPSVFRKFPNTSKFVNRLSSSFRVDKVDNIDMDALDGLDPMIVH